MTNLTNIDLSTLNLKNLQTLAKEFKVKSWWTMKKADLISELTFIRNNYSQLEEYHEEAQEETQEEAAGELGIENPIIEKDPEESTGNDTPWEDEDPNLEQEKKDLETEKRFNDNSKKAKKAKTPKVEKNEENLVTLKELAAEFHMKGTKARRLLRNAAISRPYGGNRWEWDMNLHHDELEMARAYLKEHTKKAPKEQDK